MDTRTAEKIKPIDALVQVVDNLKKQGKRVVQCHGVFDLVHPGHIRHLNSAKKEGDVLVITVTNDKNVKRGPGRPIFNEQLRAETLASLSVTDYVCIVDAPAATEYIKRIKPDVYAKGPDYKDRKSDITGKIYEEENAVKSVGGKIAFTDDVTFSSSKLINSYIDVYPPETVRYLENIAKKYPIDVITDKLCSLNKLKALVIGDAIIDQYHYCVPMGRSSKEPLVANRYLSEESFAGGSLATANNVASLCGQVDLLTILGEKDSFQNFIENKLSPNVNPTFFYRPDTGTIIKRRFITQGTNRKLFEICYLEDSFIPEPIESKILLHLESSIRKHDMVVVSDFGHGVLTPGIIDLICSKAKYLAINVQTNSANYGFNLVTKYPHANCVCIDEMELRFATHDRFGDLCTHAKKIYQQLGCENIIVTRGPEGSLTYSQSDGFHETPAFSYHVIDTIGAGDAFFAFISPCFAARFPQDIVSLIGNAVGSLAVQIICNREPVKFVDLIKFITRLLK
jgi:rfaE bifunctional protein kinase chain/domain/rfaE bifunctional protein nucleotidyltransferase chain/domain